MPVLLLQKDPADAVGRVSFQAVLAGWIRGLTKWHFVVIGALVFALALLATLPARVMLQSAGFKDADAVGTIWKGEAAIGDATAVSWRVRPLRSLLRLGLVTDVSMRGGETDLAAIGVWRPGRLTLEHLTGLAGPALVNVLIKELPIDCTLSLAVDLDRLVVAGPRSGAQGAVRSGPGQCSARNGVSGPPAQIPAMVGQSVMGGNGASAWLATASHPESGRLAQMTIDRSGKLTATILDAGALILPATAGRMAIETQLR